MLITRKAIPRRAVLQGLGATMALPLLDAMVPSLTALQKTPREAHHPIRRDVRAERDGDGAVDAGRRRRGLRADADARAAGAVPGRPARPEQSGLRAHTGAAGRRACESEHALPHRRVAADERNLARCRHLDGSDRREGDGRIDAARVARAGGRIGGNRRRVRRRVRVRVHQHDFVARRRHAAADGEQSARRVRAPVRRQRQHRRPNAARANPPGPQRARFGPRRGGAPAGRARCRRPREADRVPRRDPRRRTPHPESRGTERQGAARSSNTLRASRPPTTSTSS